MTNNEARVRCIEAIVASLYPKFHRYPREIQLKLAAEAMHAFDSLHGIATVNALEATEEMIEETYNYFVEPGDGHELFWRVMSAKGDLTRPQQPREGVEYNP